MKKKIRRQTSEKTVSIRKIGNVTGEKSFCTSAIRNRASAYPAVSV
ncbi:MAG: hypothetical protein IJN21_09510 [Clostridia bacterium]|nr:hypothetical protein [Clostridia bacterium]